MIKKTVNIITLTSLLFFGCKPELEYVKTREIGEGFYLEEYISEGGTFGSDSKYYFLTDSIYFRKNIGHMKFPCLVDVNLKERTLEVLYYKGLQRENIYQRKSFDFTQLKSDGVFESP